LFTHQANPHPLDKGVRFGWQNPIRVAPTLPPAAPYPKAPMFEEYPRTEKYVQQRPSTGFPNPKPPK